jgi:hypothetical protein
MRGLLLSALAGALMAGCAMAPPPATEKDIRTDCAQYYADPAIDPVRDRIQIPLQIGEPQPVDMLARRVKATEAERPAIKAFSGAFDACIQRAAQELGTLPSYRLRTNNRISEGFADLYAGDITYGQFAKLMLFEGERDQVERQQLDEEIRSRERWKILHDRDGF